MLISELRILTSPYGYYVGRNTIHEEYWEMFCGYFDSRADAEKVLSSMKTFFPAYTEAYSISEEEYFKRFNGE